MIVCPHFKSLTRQLENSSIWVNTIIMFKGIIWWWRGTIARSGCGGGGLLEMMELSLVAQWQQNLAVESRCRSLSPHRSILVVVVICWKSSKSPFHFSSIRGAEIIDKIAENGKKKLRSNGEIKKWKKNPGLVGSFFSKNGSWKWVVNLIISKIN